MREIKTADGNSFCISDGIVSDERGNVTNGFLTKIPKVTLGKPLEISYCYKNANGEFPRDEHGFLISRVHITAPVVMA